MVCDLSIGASELIVYVLSPVCFKFLQLIMRDACCHYLCAFGE